MPVHSLTNEIKRLLRQRAHALHPVVRIAEKGLSDSVLKETDSALLAHELIKVRIDLDDRALRQDYSAQMAFKLNAHAIQSIGKIVVLWRENPEKTKKSSPPKKASVRLKKRDFQ